MQLAQIDNPFKNILVPTGVGKAAIDINKTDLGKIISGILPYLFGISGILLLIYLLIGGLQLMFSGGDPKAMQSAQGKITNALIGFVVVFLAYWITQLFGTVLNIQTIKDIFK